MCPRGERPGSVDRGQEATGGAVEGEASILPGRALTESRQPLHVAPDGAGIRLVLFRQRVRLGGVLMRQFQSTKSADYTIDTNDARPNNIPEFAVLSQCLRCEPRERAIRRPYSSATECLTSGSVRGRSA